MRPRTEADSPATLTAPYRAAMVSRPSGLLRDGAFLWWSPAGANSVGLRWVATTTALGGAGLVAATAAIHLHLWAAGYRQIATIGPLFLLQGVAGIPLAVAVAVTRRLALLAAGAGYMAGSALGLILADTVGLFRFHDSFAAPWAGVAFATEVCGFVLLASAGAILVAARRG